MNMTNRREADMGEIQLQNEGQTAIIHIQRPTALNALNRKLVDQIGEAVESLESDETVKALVFYGKDNFAAGADVKAMVDCDAAGAKAFSFSPVFQKVADLKIPTIAAMEGYALGGGLELALACDLRLGAASLKTGFPEINLGIMPGAGGTIRAPRIIGVAAAKELIFSGRLIGAERAYEIGLINRIVKAESVLEAACGYAEKLTGKAALALRTAKETIDLGLEEADCRKGIAIEMEKWAQLFRTEDQKEGMRAFLEKRPPEYGGK